MYRARKRGRFSAGKARAFYPITFDYFPQKMSFILTGTWAAAPAPNDWLHYITTKCVLPIPRMQGPRQGGTQLVIELLKMDWEVPHGVSTAQHHSTDFTTTADTNCIITINVGTQDPGTSVGLLPASNAVIASDGAEPAMHFSNVANGRYSMEPVRHVDFTDGRGHGRLYVADSMYVTLAAKVLGAALTNQINGNYCVSFWYRWRYVSVKEYVGIVSQYLG